MLVDEFPTTWLERALQPLATKFLKRWAGLTKSANTAIMYLPVKRGGLALPSLVGLYKKLQVARMAQLFTSTDPGVRKAAHLCLLAEREKQRVQFKPAALVDEIRSVDPTQSRQTLSRATKTLLAEEEADTRHQQLCKLPTQGEMARQWEGNSPDLWVKAVQELPSEVMKFSLNASLDTLPTNSNLRTWGKKAHDTCPLCHESRQTLLHVLNNCPVAMELRRYSRRHDAVLAVLGDFIQAHLPPTFSITSDLPSATYSFPQHITPTDMRPDIVWWSDVHKELWLLELTVSYESLVADSCQRKRAKYQDLVEAGDAAGFRTELITVEVGSRGMLQDEEFDHLKLLFNVPQKSIACLCLSIIRTTILESFKIWCSRNSVH